MFSFSALYSVAGFFGGGAAQVQKDPGVIIGPIAAVFGYMIDFIFNIMYSVISSGHNTLGISIIFLTIIFRALMLPLAFKTQKSVIAMQRLNPEIEKIKKKYGNSKDPEIARKMNAEIQDTYSRNKVNPLGGCLPLFIQIPFFFGLSYIMNQSYRYVSQLGQLYRGISSYFIENMAQPVNEYGTMLYVNILRPLALPHVPVSMRSDIDISVTDDLMKVLSKFSISDWNSVLAQVPAEHYNHLSALIEQKQAIEQFFGIVLTESSGFAWPGILIPILAVITTVMTSYISSRMSVSTDPRMVSQQRMMLVVMPVMMGFMTIGLPGGVGVYWITGSVFQVAQQLLMNKQAGFKLFGPKGVQIIDAEKK